MDDLCQEAGLVPTVVKMDVQGHEFHVLQGMQRTIARNPGLVVMMEFSPALNTCAGVDTAAQWALVERSFRHRLRVDPRTGATARVDLTAVLEECAASEHVNLLLSNREIDS